MTLGSPVWRDPQVMDGGRKAPLGDRWRPVLPWIAAILSIVPLLIVVWLPGKESAPLAPAPAADPPAQPSAAPPPIIPIPEMPASLAGRPVEESRPAEARPFSVSGADDRAVGRESGGREDSGAASPGTEVHARRAGADRRYRAVETGLGLESAPVGMLRAFRVVLTAGRVSIEDDDGSVYRGRLTPLPQGSGVLWTCEARGVHAGTGRRVVLTGNFGGDPREATGDGGGSVLATDAVLGLAFRATVLVGDQSFDMRAEPVEP